MTDKPHAQGQAGEPCADDASDGADQREGCGERRAPEG